MSSPNSTIVQGAVTPVDSVQGTSMASTGPSTSGGSSPATPRTRGKRAIRQKPRPKPVWTEEEWDEHNARVALQRANQEVWDKNRKEEKKRDAREKREAKKEAERRREVLHERRQRFQQAQTQRWNPQPQFQHGGMLQHTSQWNSYSSPLQQPNMMGTMQYQPALQSHQTTAPGGHYPTTLFPGQMHQTLGATQLPTANQGHGTNMGMQMHPNHQTTSLNTGMGMPQFPMLQQQHAFLSAPFTPGHQALPQQQQQQQQQQQPDLGNWHSNIPARQAMQPTPRSPRPQPRVHKPEPRWRPIAAKSLPTRAPAAVRSLERTRHDPIPLPSYPASTPAPTPAPTPVVPVSARLAPVYPVNNLDWLAAEATQYAPAQAQRFSGLAAPAAGVARAAVRGQAQKSGERVFALAGPAPAPMARMVSAPAARPAPTAMMVPAPASMPAPAPVPTAIPATAPAMAAPMGLGMAGSTNPFLPSAPAAEPISCLPPSSSDDDSAANYDCMAAIPALWDTNLVMTRKLVGGEMPVQMGGKETPAPWADATEAPPTQAANTEAPVQATSTEVAATAPPASAAQEPIVIPDAVPWEYGAGYDEDDILGNFDTLPADGEPFAL